MTVRKTFKRFVFLSACFLALSTTAAPAPLVVDSSQTAVGFGFFVTRPPLAPRWQEFVPAKDNIARIDLSITDEHRVDSVLRVWVTDSGMTTLWSTSLPDASLPAGAGWVSIDTGRIDVTPGRTYRVNLSVDKYPSDGNPAASVYWNGSTSPTAHFNNDTTVAWPTFSYAFIIYASDSPSFAAAIPTLGNWTLVALVLLIPTCAFALRYLADGRSGGG